MGNILRGVRIVTLIRFIPYPDFIYYIMYYRVKKDLLEKGLTQYEVEMLF